jgi:hypothetical protein
VREAALALIAALRRLDPSAVLVVLRAVLHSSDPVGASASPADKALEDWRMLASAPNIVAAVMPAGSDTSASSATAVGSGRGARGAAAALNSARTIPNAEKLLRYYHRDKALLKAVSGLVESASDPAEASALWSKRLLEQWCIV